MACPPDWNHIYWPLLYQIAISKNEATVTKLFETATDTIEKEGPASVDPFLVDGGTALHAATKKCVRQIMLILTPWVYHVDNVLLAIPAWG